MANSFAGKVVLVTGANSGIGEAAATLFAEAGAKVFGTARRQEALEASRARHPQVQWVLADITDENAVKAAVADVVREAGRLDVVINNAGTFTFGTIDQVTPEILRAHFETNVYGPVYVTQAALPALKASRGTVINIGSPAGHKAVPGGSIYGASKAALEALTRSWALEFAPFGVRVSTVAPGPTDTAGFNKIGRTPEEVAGVKEHFTKQVPLGRMASSEEIGRFLLSIADPNVTFLTGQVISIDGGMSLS